MAKNSDQLNIAMAQISPVWLNKQATIEKVCDAIKEAAALDGDLVIFGEGLLPGYPFWLSSTNGSAFENQMQKEIHAHYIRASIEIEKGDLDPICALAKEHQLAVYLGIIERAANRGGHSLYCSLTYIDANGLIKSVHRKLQPTYEERLAWSPGDGNGLQVHPLGAFTVGGLNCWENWMPLSRTALYGLGENLHIAVWPGSERNTDDITRYIAKESRSYVVSVSGLFSKSDIPDDMPHADYIRSMVPDVMADGGSCISKPNGEWLVAPIVGKSGVTVATIDINRVYEERQNFDAVGHYSRPDVTRLHVNRERQAAVNYDDV